MKSKEKPKKRKITTGTREWADHNVNCIKGCTNNCKYCYAKIMAKRFGRCSEDTWKVMEINQKIVNTNFRKFNGRVMFPSSHDLIDTPEVKEACYIVIKKLLEVVNELLITSKPRLNIIKDIIEKFSAYKAQIQFRFTITSVNDVLMLFWEPNAPRFNERFNSLRYAFKAGFKTSVSIEPFLDYEPKKLIDKLSPYITESLWLGPMNYIPQNNGCELDNLQLINIRKNYEKEHLLEIYNDFKNDSKIRFKDSMYLKLGLKK